MPLTPRPLRTGLPGRRGRSVVALLLGLLTLCVSTLALTGPSSAQRAPSPDSSSSRAASGVAFTGLFRDAAPRSAVLDGDRRSVEIGVKFRAAVAGRVTGAQVYKLAKRPDRTPVRASLWNADGDRLASARLPRTRGTGWVSARFDKAVRIKPGHTYRVSVFAPKGRYAVTEGALDRRKDRGDLVVVGRDNGVYAYGSTSSFPSETYNASNYWVDVAFRPGKTKGGGGGGTTTTEPTTTTDPTPTTTSTTTSTSTSGAFPNADNTGVPAGVALTAYSGPSTITTPGTVIDAKKITGGLSIQASNVTITRSSITGSVSVAKSGSLTITDTDIDAGNQMGTGLEAYNYTAQRVQVVGGNRSMYCADNCTVKDSYVHGQYTDYSGVAHESGIRMEQNGTFIHNTILCDAQFVDGGPNGQTAGCSGSLTGYGDFAPVQNNLIQNNFFPAANESGATCAYGGSSAGKPYSSGARDIRFIDNVFEKSPSSQTGNTCGYWFTVTDFNTSAPGNVWQNNTWTTGGVVNP